MKTNKTIKIEHYRFTMDEVERMKSLILTHVRNERDIDSNGNLSAWRLHTCLSALSLCGQNIKTQQKADRDLALFFALTKNDMPIWC